MAINLNKSWFDEKYSGRERPTLEDRASLFAGLLKSSDRCRREVNDSIKEVLFQLNQKGRYTPSLHAIAYELVTAIGPAVSLDENLLKDYRAKYRLAIQKHRDENVFSSNFLDS